MVLRQQSLILQANRHLSLPITQFWRLLRSPIFFQLLESTMKITKPIGGLITAGLLSMYLVGCGESVPKTPASATDTVKSAVQTATDTAEQAASTAEEAVKDAGEAAGEMANEAVDKAAETAAAAEKMAEDAAMPDSDEPR
jgi:hypothetical protein